MSAVNATQAPPILHLSSVVGSPLRDSAHTLYELASLRFTVRR